MDLYNTVVDRKKTKTDKTRGREVTFLKESKARVVKATKLFKKGEVGEVRGVATREFQLGRKQQPGRRYLLSEGERREWIDEKNLEAVK